VGNKTLEGVNTGVNVNPTVSDKIKRSFASRFISIKNSFLGLFIQIANRFTGWRKPLASRSANIEQDPQSQENKPRSAELVS
jgi:hypothetical protein